MSMTDKQFNRLLAQMERAQEHYDRYLKLMAQEMSMRVPFHVDEKSAINIFGRMRAGGNLSAGGLHQVMVDAFNKLAKRVINGQVSESAGRER